MEAAKVEEQMKVNVKNGIIAGLIFGILDIIPMFFMDFENAGIAITGAFINRFAIGLLIFVSEFGIAGWIKGLIIGLLLSLPDALITGAIEPILGIGIIGGLIIGVLSDKFDHK